jgi:hypothetical protein
VVAVYLARRHVDHVANYGLKDGKVFDYVSRTTPAPGGDDGSSSRCSATSGQADLRRKTRRPSRKRQ